MTGLGRWGNGDVEVGLTSLDELPYVMGLVRQSFEQQMGDGRPGMIADLKPYPEYKDSGAAVARGGAGALGGAAAAERLRRCASAMLTSTAGRRAAGSSLQLRGCLQERPTSDGMPFMRATATGDEIARFRLAVGDVLILAPKYGTHWSSALVSAPADDLVCGYHLALLRPFTDRRIGDYLFRVMQSNGVAYQVLVEAIGVTRYGLSHSAIKSISLPTPPLPEQAAIVRFLDHADRRIRRYIRAKQKLIKLLEEQKQAIIHRAVTRGLDPNVRLKPSGVEWLGDVPEHWEVRDVNGRLFTATK